MRYINLRFTYLLTSVCMAACEESSAAFHDRSGRYQGCHSDVQHRSECWRQLRVGCGRALDQVRPLPANQRSAGERSPGKPRGHRRRASRCLRVASRLEACDQEGRFSHYEQQVNRFLVSLNHAFRSVYRSLTSIRRHSFAQTFIKPRHPRISISRGDIEE